MDRFLAEFRAEVRGNTLVGHASVFNQLAEMGGGYEEMGSEAFDAALKAPETDVRALVNHNPTMVLGRQSAGTLRLSTDKEGLRFEVDLPATSYANDLKELLARGDITGASFGFIPGDDEIRRAPDGKQIRTHLSVARLLDISPVTWPAYEGATVSLRHIEFPVRSAREQAIRVRAARLLEGRTA
jgi:HK97 family phage prohead protease